MLKLPDSLREELAKPHGRLYKDGEKVFEKIEELRDCSMLACVGDIVVHCAFLVKIKPEIIVLDGKTLRERNLKFEIPEEYSRIYAKNPPGFITPELINALKKAVELAKTRKVAVLIDGEEDLAVMPLGLLLPEKSLVVYGQPGEGVVALMIDEGVKVEILKLLKQMILVEESDELRSLGVI
ncbi:MAG: GTP-dependent dephospho-CoA kinase family protein [Archaeoglobaceae archaeon]